YKVGLPSEGSWAELLNTDADSYGGSGVGNLGRVHTRAEPWHGQPFSATVSLPPLGTLWLEPEKPGEEIAGDPSSTEAAAGPTR
ncbi:MAG: alpha amylase C-terminal domain-containing protein, partial [Actinomycetota bacterium]|nr:alpha amylase C-terminal domain-containing protein [Actinomycetota bacterium]